MICWPTLAILSPMLTFKGRTLTVLPGTDAIWYRMVFFRSTKVSFRSRMVTVRDRKETIPSVIRDVADREVWRTKIFSSITHAHFFIFSRTFAFLRALRVLRGE